jgi:hypothetical protein
MSYGYFGFRNVWGPVVLAAILALVCFDFPSLVGIRESQSARKVLTRPLWGKRSGETNAGAASVDSHQETWRLIKRRTVWSLVALGAGIAFLFLGLSLSITRIKSIAPLLVGIVLFVFSFALAESRRKSTRRPMCKDTFAAVGPIGLSKTCASCGESLKL